MEDSKPITSEETQHCLDFIAVNADRGIRKSARRLLSTPLNELCSREPDDARWKKAARTLTARRSLVSFSTRRSSFDLWASLGHLENLFSDYRRIAPRFTFEQVAGEANIAVGNEYRLTITDPNRLTALDAACNKMAPGKDTPPMAGGRAMDVRVTRAGPWGGETGELVVEALENHAMAGVSSLWLVAHGETADGLLQVTLDALEIAGWAWAPDFLADRATLQSRATVFDTIIGGLQNEILSIAEDIQSDRQATLLAAELEFQVAQFQFSLLASRGNTLVFSLVLSQDSGIQRSTQASSEAVLGATLSVNV